MRKWPPPTWALTVGSFFLLGGLFYFLMPTVDLSQNYVEKTQHSIKALEKALEAYKKDVGQYPTNVEGIHALIENPDPSSDRWKGPYGQAIETDEWGHPFLYTIPGRKGKPYFIVSGGPDNKIGTDDDISSP